MHNSLLATETCSRVAIINYQEVLVDTNSTQKGEGLRYHIEKDPIAKSHLDKYQEGTQIQWENAIIGTVGTGMIIGSLFTNSNSNNKSTLMISGATMIAINFLVARTMESANEKNLVTSIEEYNKRNLPKIYFSSEKKSADGRTPDSSGVYLEKSWSF